MFLGFLGMVEVIMEISFIIILSLMNLLNDWTQGVTVVLFSMPSVTCRACMVRT